MAPADCHPAASAAIRAILPPGPMVLPSITISGSLGIAANVVAASSCAEISAWARCQPVMAVRAPAVTTIRVMLPPGRCAGSYPTVSEVAQSPGATVPGVLAWAIASAPTGRAGGFRLGFPPRPQPAVPAWHPVCQYQAGVDLRVLVDNVLDFAGYYRCAGGKDGCIGSAVELEDTAVFSGAITNTYPSGVADEGLLETAVEDFKG